MQRQSIIFGSLLTLLACGTSIRSDEQEGTPPAAIEIVTDDGKTLSLTAADLAILPRKDLAAKDHSGEEAKYAGVRVADLLKQANVPLGERLRSQSLSCY